MADTIQNFGGNQRWQPNVLLYPQSEADVLAILRAHRGRNLRTVGRLHSWSEAPVGNDVLLDLRHLRHIRIDGATVDVGAGCQIKHLLEYLNRRGYTLPALGLIDEQTIAGATATGTHGSGKPSLAHYVQAVRLAGYDATTGEASIRTLEHGPTIRAARCALGTMGVLTALRLPIRPQYNVEEHFAAYATVADVFAQEATYPIQQFYFLPWRWDYFAQHRREVAGPPSRLAWLYRLYWCIGMDVGLHIIVRLLARHLPTSCTPFFFRRVLTMLVPRPWRVVDRSDRQLTMQHELFRHIEIEVFVRRPHVPAALADVRQLLESYAASGRYVHHYPICVRKVLPDDTLLSMTADWDEPGYALSFICYAPPRARSGFHAFAYDLATLLAQRYDARPHWGKYNPLPAAELRRLYPALSDFRTIADAFDPTGCFRNAWLAEILRPPETPSC